MKAVFAGFAAMIVIAFGGWYLLGQAGFSTEEVDLSVSVRLA